MSDNERVADIRNTDTASKDWWRESCKFLLAELDAARCECAEYKEYHAASERLRQQMNEKMAADLIVFNRVLAELDAAKRECERWKKIQQMDFNRAERAESSLATAQARIKELEGTPQWDDAHGTPCWCSKPDGKDHEAPCVWMRNAWRAGRLGKERSDG